MNRTEYLKFHQQLCDDARSLSERKNHDYAGRGGEHPFANFQRCESMGVCTTEQGFLVRMTDKMSRLSSFVEAGCFAVSDEKLRDTIMDLINYSALFLAYCASKKQCESAHEYDGE